MHAGGTKTLGMQQAPSAAQDKAELTRDRATVDFQAPGLQRFQPQPA